MTKLEKYALITTTGVLIWSIFYSIDFIISIINSNPSFGFFLVLFLSALLTNLFVLLASYIISIEKFLLCVSIGGLVFSGLSTFITNPLVGFFLIIFLTILILKISTMFDLL